jgi:hypothetical protein
MHRPPTEPGGRNDCQRRIDPDAALDPGMVAMDREGRIRIPRAGAITAAILRIGIGLIYLWGFISAGFGVHYTN